MRENNSKDRVARATCDVFAIFWGKSVLNMINLDFSQKKTMHNLLVTHFHVIFQFVFTILNLAVRIEKYRSDDSLLNSLH